MRAARDAFVAGARATIEPPAAFIDKLTPGLIVASYQPLGGEADPARLIEAATARGCALALPHVTGRKDTLRFLRWRPDDTLHPGPFGLSQPHPENGAVIPDIVLVPLVAFDPALNRLGQGAGHYDRALAGLPAALRVGVAWAIQQIETLPLDPWDMPLHAVITENGWIDGAQKP